MATNYSFNVDSPFLQRTQPKPGDRTSSNPFGLSFGGGYSDAYTKIKDRFNQQISDDLKSQYSFLDDKSLDKLNPQNKQNSNPLSDSNSKEKNKFNLGKSLLNGVSSLGRGIGNFAINTGIWKDFNPEKGLFSEDEDGNKHFDFGQAIGNGLGNTGRLLGFASNFIPQQEQANNKNNQMAQEVASTVGQAAMKSGNPFATLYGGALLMGQKLGINNQGSDTGNTGIDLTNSALSLVPGLGLLGKKAGTYHENAMVNASHSYGNIGDQARKNSNGRFIVGGNKIKNSIEDANRKTVVADSILTDAKRDFTTDIGMIAQRINMGLTEGQDRVTNFGPAAAKQGAVLQFTKRTLSKHKIKKQQSDKPEEVITQEPINEQVDSFKEGGKVNVIPEGALHKNKHHLEEVDEKFEDVTTKGIPVIVESEDGEVIQQAEVEREEIIFRLEVTKKLEELSKKHTDEAAIEAGKLLVKEILYNTEDNTGKMI